MHTMKFLQITYVYLLVFKWNTEQIDSVFDYTEHQEVDIHSTVDCHTDEFLFCLNSLVCV